MSSFFTKDFSLNKKSIFLSPKNAPLHFIVLSFSRRWISSTILSASFSKNSVVLSLS
jgi:hypothetical protein